MKVLQIILVKSTDATSLVVVLLATCNGIRAITSDSLSKRSQLIHPVRRPCAFVRDKNTKGLVNPTFSDFLKRTTSLSLDRSGCNACQDASDASNYITRPTCSGVEISITPGGSASGGLTDIFVRCLGRRSYPTRGRSLCSHR